ncbi:MAG: SufB/SufD family protein [Candidatus Micrarchaeia archaeon]
MSMEEISYAENTASLNELYKRHTLSEKAEISGILAGSYNSTPGAFEDFAEDAEEKLMINFDAFVCKNGHMISSDAIKISNAGKSKPLHESIPYMLSSSDSEYLTMLKEKVDKRIEIEINEGENQSLSIALSNFKSPIVSNIEIVAGKNSNLKLFVLFLSEQKRASLNASSLRVVAEAGASAEINILHNEDENTHALHFSSFSLEDRSSLLLNSTYIGSKSSIVRNFASLRGEHSNFRSSSSIVLSQEQKIDMFNSSLNLGIGSSYFGDVHAILSGNSLGFVKDMSSIAPNSKGASAYIKERAIMASQKARISLLPDMSINENDVKATHSAASAPIEEESLFYLMSKGLPRIVAESMILEGFVSDNISTIIDPIARSIILSHLHAKVISGEFGKLVNNSTAGAWSNTNAKKEMFEGGAKYSGQEKEQEDSSLRHK